MSEYLQVLKRLEAEHSARPADRVETAPVSLRTVAAKPAPSHAPVIREAPPHSAPAAPAAATAYATLFDNLRAAIGNQPLRSLVVGGVSAAEPVHAVASGLLAHVEGLGITARTLKLADASGRLVLLPVGNDQCVPARLPTAGERETWPSEFAHWLHLAPGAEMVIVEGLPLCHSIDSALLARGCDGLVIVVRPAVTRRDELRQAAERARGAGCRVLGLVACEA